MSKPITCKELAEILLKTPDQPVMIAKAKVDGDLDGIWMDSFPAHLDKQYIKTITLKDGTKAVVLDDDPWE